MRLNGSTAALKYYGAAHTGDTFWNGIYPFIDYSTGGNIDGMIRAADANLAASTDRTLVIPGHGQPVSNRAQLQEYRDMLVAIRGNVVDSTAVFGRLRTQSGPNRRAFDANGAASLSIRRSSPGWCTRACDHGHATRQPFQYGCGMPILALPVRWLWR